MKPTKYCAARILEGVSVERSGRVSPCAGAGGCRSIVGVGPERDVLKRSGCRTRPIDRCYTENQRFPYTFKCLLVAPSNLDRQPATSCPYPPTSASAGASPRTYVAATRLRQLSTESVNHVICRVYQWLSLFRRKLSCVDIGVHLADEVLEFVNRSVGLPLVQ